ncbi:MAG TPA: Coq4 family protein [Alphaproteobacteria bacterium]|nr:Coq4 family protein [Alphaproteobacteria bacterium]
MITHAVSSDVDQVLYGDLNSVPPRPVQWRRAAAMIRAISRQGDDVLNVTYALVDALGGMCEERLFQRFRGDPEGQRILAARPDLPRLLSDHAALASLPEGSFGRAYADLCRQRGINSAALVESQRNMSRDYAKLDPARQWFSDRLTVLHDLWHILTGYAAAPRGEAAIVAFSYAQGLDYRPMPIFLALSVIMRVARIRELWQAYQRGKRTMPLILQSYEELLPLPLATVRARLKLPDGRSTHGSHPADGLLA